MSEAIGVLQFHDTEKSTICWRERSAGISGLNRLKGNKGEMNRDEALKLLRAHKTTLVQRFGVVDLALFGSIVRDQATDDSDVDILVRFDSPATSKRYFGVQFYIEDLFGRPVDLVTDKALREEMRPYIEREMVNV